MIKKNIIKHNLTNFSLKNEICLKGILSILVIISHSNFAEQIKIGENTLSSLNYFVVAVFFFLSGFGLIQQRNQKKEFNVLKKFVSLLLPYYIVSLMWVLFFDKNISMDNFFKIIMLRNITPYCWYVKSQLILYIIWWIDIKIMDQYKKTNEIYHYAIIFCLLLIYAFNQYYNSITSTTYITIFCFLFGIIYGNHFHESISKKSFFISEFVLLLIVGLSVSFFPREDSVLSYIILNITSGLFSIFVIQLLYFVNFENRIAYFLGKKSYYIYIVQCIAQCLFQKTYFCNVTYFPVYNIYLRLFYTLIVDLFLAILLSKLVDIIIKLFKRKG